MNEIRICPFCGKSTYDSIENVKQITTASRKGTARNTTYFHESCYLAETAKRREQREKKDGTVIPRRRMRMIPEIAYDHMF